MKNKIIIFTLIFSLCLCFCSCSTNDSSNISSSRIDPFVKSDYPWTERLYCENPNVEIPDYRKEDKRNIDEIVTKHIDYLYENRSELKASFDKLSEDNKKEYHDYLFFWQRTILNLSLHITDIDYFDSDAFYRDTEFVYNKYKNKEYFIYDENGYLLSSNHEYFDVTEIFYNLNSLNYTLLNCLTNGMFSYRSDLSFTYDDLYNQYLYELTRYFNTLGDVYFPDEFNEEE